ncbi:MAG: tetratricopeptide repeat protein [Candidatus Obscuribacterales bacterium]|nr:tetratricopeptide repeat protein [Candidatus Obscuribacterales bacterium]
MYKPVNIALSAILVIDCFFVGYAGGLNARRVKIIDASLGPPPAVARKPAPVVVTTAPSNTRAASEVLLSSFEDLKNTDPRLQETVTKAAEVGIIDPVKDKRFRPNDPVTRGDFTRWMVRIRQVASLSPAAPTYSDLERFNPYYDEIEGATSARLVQGYTVKGQAQKEFKPLQHITREEFCVLYGTFSNKRSRAEKLTKEEIDKYLCYNPSTSDFGTSTYADSGEIDDWARKWVAVAHQAGVLEQSFASSPYAAQTESKYFHPLEKMTRAEAVNILVKLYGLQARSIIEICEGLDKEGRFYDKPGAYPQAEALYESALSIREKAFSPEHPHVAESCTNLGALYETQNEKTKAEPLYQRALDIRQKSLGYDHPSVADSLNSLADLHTRLGKLEVADALYQKLLERDQRVLGKRSAAVAGDLQNLSKVRAALSRPDAQPLQAQALALRQTLPGGQNVQQLSEPSLSGKPASATEAERPVKDKWALVVGVSNFKDPSINLKYAAKDASDFRDWLVTEGHFQADHVKLLTNAKATRDNIVSQLGDSWLGRLANRDDLVVVYISSHGSQAKDEAGGVNFLVAYDTNKNSLLGTGIPMQWLTKIVRESVHCDRVVLVLDVCHSGAANVDGKGITREPGFDVAKISTGEGQAVMCSSLAEQISWESKTYHNSVFTRRLIDGLRSHGADTKLTDAYEFMRDRVETEVLRDRGEEQTPVLNLSKWKGAPPVLSVPPASPRPGM